MSLVNGTLIESTNITGITTAASPTIPLPSALSPSSLAIISIIHEPSQASSSSTSGATPVATVTILVHEKSKSELPIGPIIGGALGAFTFICIVLLLLYLRRRRREGHYNEVIGGLAPVAIGKNSQFLRYLRWLIIPVPCLSSIQEDHGLAPMNFHDRPSTAAQGNYS